MNRYRLEVEQNYNCINEDLKRLTDIRSCSKDISYASITPLKVVLNVRGCFYETYSETLDRFPETLIGTKEKRDQLYDGVNDWINLNCSPRVFDGILFYFQSRGHVLARPIDTDLNEFIDTCEKFHISRKEITNLRKKEGHIIEIPTPVAKEDTFKFRLWKFLEDPSYSYTARIYALVSVLFILTSTFVNCLVSIPPIRDHRTHNLHTDPWVQVEISLNVFFALEFLVRFFAAPNRRFFMRELMNIVDLVAVFPYFIAILVTANNFSNLVFIKALRVLRLLRLFNLSKNSDTITLVLTIVRDCASDLVLLLLCLFIITFTCGSMEFYVESSHPGTAYISLPESMWWALQTVVSLGYGDIVPGSTFGKVIGSFVAIFGVLTLTIPLLSLGGKYLHLYNQAFEVYVGPDLVSLCESKIGKRGRRKPEEILKDRKAMFPGFISASTTMDCIAEKSNTPKQTLHPSMYAKLLLPSHVTRSATYDCLEKQCRTPQPIRSQFTETRTGSGQSWGV